MATSTLRAAIIVAALVFGGIVLANAFPGGDTSGPSTNIPTTTSPTSPVSPTTAPPTTPPVLEGALLQVLNGSGMDGLAGTVATCLREQGGADIPAETHVGNAPERSNETTLVYRKPDRRALAELLRTRFFPGAKILEGSEEPTPPNEVTIILGSDYAPEAECQG